MGGRVVEPRVASSSWTYFWARDKISFMLVMSSFTKCFVEGMVGLQFGNECLRNNIVATIINHSHLVMNITNVAFDGLSWLHFDGEEVVAVLLKFLSRGVLIEKCIANLL